MYLSGYVAEGLKLAAAAVKKTEKGVSNSI